MTSTEFAAIKDQSRMSHREIGDYLGLSGITAQQYGNGRLKIPGPVAKLMEMLACTLRKAKHSSVCEETEFSADETEFLLAVERYKRESRRSFLSNAETLKVLISLGYRKPALKLASEKTCCICRETFKPISNGQKTCGKDECQQENQKNVRAKYRKPARDCVICGDSIQDYRGLQKTCSKIQCRLTNRDQSIRRKKARSLSMSSDAHAAACE